MADQWNLKEGIDLNWLERLAEREPVIYAYAAWDYRHYPGRARFVTLQHNGDPQAFLLIWMAPSGIPEVHWMSRQDNDAMLLQALPERPMTAVVPERVLGSVTKARSPVTMKHVEVMEHVDMAPPTEHLNIAGRRLSKRDEAELASFLEGIPKEFALGYRGIALGSHPVWGAFEGKHLASIAHASVTLKEVWILNGVITAEKYRGRGFGRAAVAASLSEAKSKNARVGLYVLSDNEAALRTYRGLGFRPIDHRVRIDASAPA